MPQETIADTHTTRAEVAILESIERAAKSQDALIVGAFVDAYAKLVGASTSDQDNAHEVKRLRPLADALDAVQDTLKAAGIDIAAILPVQVTMLVEERDDLRKEMMALTTELANESRWRDRVANMFQSIDERLAKAFHDATKQASVSVLDKDMVAATVDAQGDEPTTRVHAERIAALASSAPKLRAELDAANAEVKQLRSDETGAQLRRFLDAAYADRDDANAECAKLRMELELLSGERHTLTKQLAATKHALRLANTQMGVAHANLSSALELHQQVPAAHHDIMGKLTKLIAFWRKGDESYRLAADALEQVMRNDKHNADSTQDEFDPVPPGMVRVSAFAKVATVADIVDHVPGRP